MIETQIGVYEALETLYKSGPDSPYRHMAWKHFIAQGLPTRQSSRFSEIPLRKLYSLGFSTSEKSVPLIPSRGTTPEGIIVLPISQAMRTWGTFLRNHFSRATKEKEDPFILLNTAISHDGLFVYVPPGTVVDIPLQLNIYLGVSGTIAPSQIVLYVGQGSRAAVVMNTLAEGKGSFMNGLCDIILDDDAHLDCVQIANECPSTTCYFDHSRISLKKNSVFNLAAMMSGSDLMRYYYSVDFQDTGASASLNTLSLLAGNRQCHLSSHLHHRGRGCLSSQVAKMVVKDAACASLTGSIVIDKSAQDTDARQTMNGLQLGDRSRVVFKPHMEIFADSVIARHGATVGSFDADQLFYLKSRGMADFMAKNLLVAAFCKEIVDGLPSPSLKNLFGVKALTFFRSEVADDGSRL